MKTKTLVRTAGAIATLATTLFTANAQGPGRGRGLPAEARETIHGLFDSHDKFDREVQVTDAGYVSKTTSKDPAMVKLLQTHVKQMERRLKQGMMVRRWDPAYAEFVKHYDDIDIKITNLKNGISITTVGATEDAKKVARNHAGIISKFIKNGWSEHDKTHPAVAGKTAAGAAATDEKPQKKTCAECAKPPQPKADAEGKPCAECAKPQAKAKAKVKPCVECAKPQQAKANAKGKPCTECAKPQAKATAKGKPCAECAKPLAKKDSKAQAAARPIEPYKLGSTKPIHAAGDIYLAAQPEPEDFQLAKKQGIKTVINLRHDKEIVGFDEKKVAEAAGLNYVHLPWNGADELTDDTFDRTRKLLATAERPILLHCGSSNRVGAVWLPWRVLDGGVEIEKAVAEAKSIGLKKAEYETKARDYIRRNQSSD